MEQHFRVFVLLLFFICFCHGELKLYDSDGNRIACVYNDRYYSIGDRAGCSKEDGCSQLVKVFINKVGSRSIVGNSIEDNPDDIVFNLPKDMMDIVDVRCIECSQDGWTIADNMQVCGAATKDCSSWMCNENGIAILHNTPKNESCAFKGYDSNMCKALVCDGDGTCVDIPKKAGVYDDDGSFEDLYYDNPVTLFHTDYKHPMVFTDGYAYRTYGLPGPGLKQILPCDDINQFVCDGTTMEKHPAPINDGLQCAKDNICAQSYHCREGQCIPKAFHQCACDDYICDISRGCIKDPRVKQELKTKVRSWWPWQ